MNHGTMFYKAVKEGLINPEKSIQIGINFKQYRLKSFLKSEGIRTFNQDTLGFNIFGADWVHENGVDRVRSFITIITEFRCL